MGNNLDIRAYAKSKGVFMYELAQELGISDPTIMRWLRAEISADRKSEIYNAIDCVAARRVSQVTASATN